MTVTATDLDVATDVVIDLRGGARFHVPIRVVPEILATRRQATYERAIKPVVDRLAAGVLLVLALPVLVLVSVAVRLSLGPDVLFRQERIGLGGRPFTVYKFRTMLPDRRADGSDRFDGTDRRRTHKTLADPRHTRLGRFLRAFSLDELPQLFNMLRGEMSLVGPRPEIASVVARYEPWEHFRHTVRPGLTGVWQITARSEGPMHRFTSMDVAYAASVSAWTDVRILLRTFPAMLWSQRGT